MKTKSIFKFALNLVTAFLFSLILGFAIEEKTQVNPFDFAAYAVGATLAIQFIGVSLGYSVNSYAFMALQTQVWTKDIMDNIYANNDFMKFSRDFSQFIANKTVHIPQAGAASAVEKNRSSFPATITSRTDSEKTFDMSEFTIDPIVIQNLEELQISYDKRQSVMFNIYEQLAKTVALQTLYTWAPSGASRLVSTTGSTSTLNLPHSTATGSRKMITLNDIAAVRKKFDEEDIPQDGRKMLLPAGMFDIDILGISNVAQAYAFGQPVLPSGQVGRIMGFDIMVRSSVLVYDSGGVIKPIDGDGTVTTPATGDLAAGIAWHPNFVGRAVGGVEMFYQEKDPTYYGNIISGLVMHGATQMYSNQRGIVGIIQA